MGCATSKESSSSAAVVVEATPSSKQKAAAAAAAAAADKTSNISNGGGSNDDDENDNDDDLVFFDAYQSFSEAMGTLEYAPTASMIPGGKRTASVAMPQSMLLLSKYMSTTSILLEEGDDEDSKDEGNNDNNKDNTPIATTHAATNTKIPPSTRQSVIEIKEKLGSSQHSVAIHGYPGQLDEDELEACLKFRDALKLPHHAVYREMVHAYAPAEDEAFALCRFLRSRAFDVDAIFQMLRDNHAADVWRTSQRHDFYQPLDHHYHGCPLPVLMQLFPVVIHGLAKNGATVFYFKPSSGMDVTALECVCDMPGLVPYLWYMLHHGGTASMQREQINHNHHNSTTTSTATPRTVLSERIIVFDMKAIPSALFHTEFMKEGAKITACFPETMNRTYMLNVPLAFTAVWAVAKLFMEARTIAKIGFFSRESRATQDLLGFVDGTDLLSDYGGSGPSFEDVLKRRQAEVGDCDRWIVNCITTTVRNPNFSFELTSREKVSFGKVFSKGDSGCSVTVTAISDDAVVIPSTNIKRQDDAAASTGGHYSVSLDTSKLHGERQYQVEARGTVKENYLVVLGVNQTA